MNNSILLIILVIVTLSVFTLNNAMDLFWKVKGTINKINRR